jgi:uncharacterized membrane protein YphA (DoxX/SURF4 family)
VPTDHHGCGATVRAARDGFNRHHLDSKEEMMEGSSPARLYALSVGVVFTIAGVIGFFYNASFDVGDSLQSDAVFGILEVNAWHNIIHILTGVLGLLAAGYAARAYALGLGLVYVVVAFLGFIDLGTGDLNDTILQFIPVNTEDNILHLAIGVLGLAAGAATPREVPRTTPARVT